MTTVAKTKKSAKSRKSAKTKEVSNIVAMPEALKNIKKAIVLEHGTVGRGRVAKSNQGLSRAEIQMPREGRFTELRVNPSFADSPFEPMECAAETLATPGFKVGVCAIKIEGLCTADGLYKFPEGTMAAAIIRFGYDRQEGESFAEVKLLAQKATPEFEAMGYKRMPVIVESAQAVRTVLYGEGVAAPAEPTVVTDIDDIDDGPTFDPDDLDDDVSPI